MKLIFIIVIIGITFTSCEKYDCVKDAAPEMIGEWTHLSEDDGFHMIYINKNGRGSMNGINSLGKVQDTQGRGWYIKDDILYFSRYQNKVPQDMFTIDLYPTIADTVLALEFDTIPIGTAYMELNGKTYRKRN